jgi:hypothetical protein
MWHNLCMARGWESKDVESQVASRENMAAPSQAKKAQDQLEKDRERANVEPESQKTVGSSVGAPGSKIGRFEIASLPNLFS